MLAERCRVEPKPAHDVHSLFEVRVSLQAVFSPRLGVKRVGEEEDVPCPAQAFRLDSSDELSVESHGITR